MLKRRGGDGHAPKHNRNEPLGPSSYLLTRNPLIISLGRSDDDDDLGSRSVGRTLSGQWGHEADMRKKTFFSLPERAGPDSANASYRERARLNPDESVIPRDWHREPRLRLYIRNARNVLLYDSLCPVPENGNHRGNLLRARDMPDSVCVCNEARGGIYTRLVEIGRWFMYGREDCCRLWEERGLSVISTRAS